MRFMAIGSVACSILFVLFSPAGATEIRVPCDSPTVQQAIDLALPGDTIIVSPGTYRESIDFRGKAITVRSINPEDQALVAATVIMGKRNTPCVSFVNSEGPESRLSGFTLIHDPIEGFAAEPAIFCQSSPTITKNFMTANPASAYGSGVCCHTGASPVISDNTIALNTGHAIVGYGAGSPLIIANRIMSNASSGIMLWSSEVRARIIGNVISGNASDYGGAIHHHDGPSIIASNIMTDNTAHIAGAALLINSDITVLENTIVDNKGKGGIFSEAAGLRCTIVGNTISGSSGGISGYEVHGVVARNVITDNDTWGGISLESSFPILFDNVIAGNSSAYGAGGIDLTDGTVASITNCTVVGNVTQSDAGGLACSDRSLVFLANSVISGNSAPGAREVVVTDGSPAAEWNRSSVTIKHSIISGGQDAVAVEGYSSLDWLDGNIDADPLFVEPGRWDGDTFVLGDYHLLPGSPCIDAGTNDVDNPDTPEIETLPATDIAGLRRVIDGNLDGTATVDIGAYEYLPGDVNYDGRVNVLDLILVRNSLGHDPASSIEARKADVNADGSVNVLDLLVVRGRLGGGN